MHDFLLEESKQLEEVQREVKLLSGIDHHATSSLEGDSGLRWMDGGLDVHLMSQLTSSRY